MTGFYAAPMPALPGPPGAPPGNPSLGTPPAAPPGAPPQPAGHANGAAPFFTADEASRYNCIPNTAFGYNPYGIQLVMTPGRLTWINQYNHIVRRIDIGQPPPKHIAPSYTGYSSAHWDGDTLVVRTTALRRVEINGLPLDATVDRIDERIRRLDTGQLERDMRVSARTRDGKSLTVQSVSTYEPKAGLVLYEFVCEDGAGYFGQEQ